MLHAMQAIILAAGKSSRCNTQRSKLVQKVCGKSVILYQTSLFRTLSVQTTMVVGHEKDELCTLVGAAHPNEITFVEQEEQKGTGHALACSRSVWKEDHVLVCNGDVPLITKDIIEQLYHAHVISDASITFVTAVHTYPEQRYGKVVRTQGVIRIAEGGGAHADDEEQYVMNAGVYLFKRSFLQQYIDCLPLHASKNEYYLTDLINIAADHAVSVHTIAVPFDRVRGVNTLEELWAVEHIKRSELIKEHMCNGVRFVMPHNTHVDIGVRLASGVVIGNGVQLTGNSSIGKNTIIEHYSVIHESTIGEAVSIKSHSVLDHATVHQKSSVGPFAYLRNETVLEQQAIVGTFVELKKTVLGERSKAKHLTYLADASIGAEVNIGGGTITANHDGIAKNKTIIKDNAYIGAHNTLVAPIQIDTHAYTAAGSTITESVAPDSFAIARARQVTKIGYVPFLKNKIKEKKESTKNRDARAPEHPFTSSVSVTSIEP